MNVRGFIEPEDAVELIFTGRIDFSHFKELFMQRGQRQYEQERFYFVRELGEKIYETSGSGIYQGYKWFLGTLDPLGNKDYPMYDWRGLYVYDAQGDTGKENYRSRLKAAFKERGVENFDDKDFNFRIPNCHRDLQIRVIGFTKDGKWPTSENMPPSVNGVRNLDAEAREFLGKEAEKKVYALVPPKKSLLNYEFDPTLKISGPRMIKLLKKNQVDYDGFVHHVIKRGEDYANDFVAFNARAVEAYNQKNGDERGKYLSYEAVFEQKVQHDIGLKTFKAMMQKYQQTLMFNHNMNFYNLLDQIDEKIYGEEKKHKKLLKGLKERRLERSTARIEAKRVEYGENLSKHMEKVGLKKFSKKEKGKEKLDDID